MNTITTMADVSMAELAYKLAQTGLKQAKDSHNKLLDSLYMMKKQLPLKQYNELKKNTKQARIKSQAKIEECFNRKHQAHIDMGVVRQEYNNWLNTKAIDQMESIADSLILTLSESDLQLVINNKTKFMGLLTHKASKS